MAEKKKEDLKKRLAGNVAKYYYQKDYGTKKQFLEENPKIGGGTFQKILAGSGNPTLEVLEDIADALKVDVKDLLEK